MMFTIMGPGWEIIPTRNGRLDNMQDHQQAACVSLINMHQNDQTPAFVWHLSSLSHRSITFVPALWPITAFLFQLVANLQASLSYQACAAHPGFQSIHVPINIIMA